MNQNLYALLTASASTSPDAPFLCAPGATAQSYGAIDELAGRYGAVLEAAGVQPGERVVARVEKSPGAVALYLACLRVGAVHVPLNVAYRPEEVAFYLGDAEPRLFVCRPEDEVALAPIARQCGVDAVRTLDEDGAGSLGDAARGALPGEHGCRPAAVVPRSASDPAAMLYTSGTTGRPKGAVLTHGGLAANARALCAAWGWRPDDVLLHALPIFHVHGLFVALHCAMLGGSQVVFLPRFEVGAVREALPRCTVMMGVPTFYTRLLADPDFGREDCARMRVFISGSAPLADTVHRAFEERTGQRILERYGMTEAAIITSNPLDGERVGGTVGYALPGVELRVVGEEGAALSAGEVGGIEVRGPSLLAGYWRLPEKTRAELRSDGFFKTGDLGQLAEDGRLTLVGRASDLVISGGYNVYPKEIERVLDEVEGVAESAVVGLPHPDLGEAVAAFVVGKQDRGELEAAMQASLGERLARFKHPKRFFFTDELPRNAMGKVEKAVLRRAHADAFAAHA